MGTGLFRSLDLDEEAILFLVPDYFAMHSTICIAYAKPDSVTQGNFMGMEELGMQVVLTCLGGII